MSHTCRKCNQSFSRMDALTRHIKSVHGESKRNANDDMVDEVKKSVEAIRLDLKEEIKGELMDEIKGELKLDLVAEAEEKAVSQTTILNLARKLHNIMRTEQIIGSKAMHDIMKMLFLRFIQPLIKTGGKLETLIKPESYLSKELDEEGKQQYVENFEEINLQYLDIDKLSVLPDEDSSFENTCTKIWKRVLSKHPLTEKIFKSKDYFKPSHKCIRMCLVEICKTLRTIDFDNLDHDVKGSLYEHFINDYADKGGKEFGQFFTPRQMLKLISKLSKKYFNIKPISIYDPCMGTAGFLTEMYKEHKATLTDINVAGGELEPDTYTIALMNVMLTTGSLCKVKCCDSLTNNENIKYDLIGTNPPFGMKGIKYKDVIKNCAYKNVPVIVKKGDIPEKKELIAIDPMEMYPIKTNDGSALFLQHVIAKLAINGVCYIVLPDGKLISSKPFTKLRKYLIQTCKLMAVLCAPNGTFSNAGVKTITLLFTKQLNDEGKYVPTEKVDFYTCDKACSDNILTGTIDITQLESKNYNLDYSAYQIREVKFNGAVQIKTLGEVCKLVKGKHSTTRTVADENKKFKFITVASEEKWKYCDIEDHNCEAVFISNVSSGSVWPLHYYNGRFAYCDLLRMLTTDISVILPKYLYYYLKVNVQNDIMDNYIKGAANKSLDVDKFNSIQIPIPSIEQQKQIIDDCQVYEKKKANLTEYISILKQEADIIKRTKINTLFMDEKCEKKTLGEVCTIKNGKNITTAQLIEGPYPAIGGGQSPMGYHNMYNTEENTILCSSSGSYSGYISKYDKKIWASDCMSITPDVTKILNMYVFYYLLTVQDGIYKLQSGAGQPHVYKSDLQELQIPIPSIEQQEQIIKQYEEKMKLIESLNDKINNIENEINQCTEKQKMLF